jgi:hypothetical protein
MNETENELLTSNFNASIRIKCLEKEILTLKEELKRERDLFSELIDNCLASTADASVVAYKIEYRKDLYERARQLVAQRKVKL